VSNYKKLLDSTIIYAIGNFGSKILTFLLIPLYSFFLSKEELGEYDLIVSTISLLVPLTTIQISDAVYRWLISMNVAKNKKKIISIGFLVINISFILMTFILYTLSHYIKLSYFFFFVFLLLLSCYYIFMQQTLRGLGLNKSYAKSGVFYSFSLVITNAIVLCFFNLNVEGLLLAGIIANALTVIVITTKENLLSYLVFKDLSFLSVKKMMKYSFPLMPNAISWWLISIANRYIILYALGTEYNGLFAISSRFPAILNIINSIFILAWQDQLLQNKGSNSNNFSAELFKKYSSFQLSLAILLIPFSQIVTIYLVDEKFYEAWKYIPLLFLANAYATLSSYFGAYYLKSRKTLQLFITTILGGVINLLFCHLTIDYIGLHAATIGTLLGFVFVFFLRIYQVSKIEKVKFQLSHFIFLNIIALTVICAQLLDKKLYTTLSIVFVVMFFVYENREIVQKGIKLIKSLKK